MNAIGTGIDLLDVGRLRSEFPLFDLGGVGIAAWEPGAGYADPVATTAGLLARAGELSAIVKLHTRVEDLRPRAGGGASISLATGGLIDCERILIAAGPWTRSIAASLAEPLPLTVERHYVATIRWSGAGEMRYTHADVVGGYYCKPEGEDLYCLGPLTAEPEADPDLEVRSIDPDESRHMAIVATRRIPRLKEAVSTGGWASLYDVSPDWMPVIGEVAPGVFVDAGTSGHGFKLGPALGADVAALVMAAEVDPGILALSPDRFGADRRLAAGYGPARILG
jgi:glycine/D-amino acid oxidase-like deaminating enzyme